METVSAQQAVAAIKSRFMMRDRIVAVCVADYTDMALGLGETKLGMALFACSSASVAQAHSSASRMGHAAGTMDVDGLCGEDFHHLLGVAGKAWSRQSDWEYKYIEARAMRLPSAELGLFYVRGDLKRAVPDLGPSVQKLKRLMSMYGVESSEPTKTLRVKQKTSTLEEPSKHPLFWSWLRQCAQEL